MCRLDHAVEQSRVQIAARAIGTVVSLVAAGLIILLIAAIRSGL
jgi:hypothetical protein